MSTLLPALANTTWDVVSDDQGFSAEGSAERDLAADEIATFETAAAHMPPIVRGHGELQIRGMATVDDGTLWVYVHAVGPGPYDESAARAAEAALMDLWGAIHTAAAQA
jgi:hypothetical protein